MRRIGILLALALAGCAGGEYQQLRGPRGGGAGLPEVAMRNNPESVVPPGRGAPSALAVRTFIPGGADWVEVEGARCRVQGGEYFRADLVTPARLVLPDLGPDAPPLTAECASGAMRGADAVAPVFAWPAEGRPGAWQRFSYGGGWWWGFQETGPMRYPDLAVALR